MNDEIPFRNAGAVAGLAYNTIRRLRHQGELPFPVHERLLPGRTKPRLYCRVSEIEAWKEKTTVRVPAGRQ
jgi:hypothetical protein